MPNYVISKITGDFTTDDIMPYISDRRLCFNKIIPMPKQLDIPESSETDMSFDFIKSLVWPIDSLRIFRKQCENLNYFIDFLEHKVEKSDSDEVFDEETSKLFEKTIMKPFDKDSVPDAIAHNKRIIINDCRAFTNLVQYGYTTWYDWRRYNWGTSKNSHSTEINNEVLTFQTAWSVPVPIIVKLSELLSTKLDAIYADEDVGRNAGHIICTNGMLITHDRYKADSQDAFQAYMDLWGKHPQLKKDKNGNYYMDI